MTNLDKICNDVRIDIINLAYKAGSGGAHCGGSLSAVEILVALYHKCVKWDPGDLDNRDRVIISKAHASLAQYCVLKSRNIISAEELATFEQNGSHYTVHAKKDIDKGFEFSGGSLALGLSYATGVAYALKGKESAAKVYVLLGDGECDEGLVWESLMFAKHNHLDNLCVIVDHNHLQADGFVEDVLDTTSLTAKFRAFGFDTQEIDGHSTDAIIEALSRKSGGAPVAIIAETIKGKGVSFMENNYKWHFTNLPESKYLKAINDLTSH